MSRHNERPHHLLTAGEVTTLHQPRYGACGQRRCHRRAAHRAVLAVGQSAEYLVAWYTQLIAPALEPRLGDATQRPVTVEVAP